MFGKDAGAPSLSCWREEKFERGKGVRGLDDRDVNDRYGSERERYNGVGGGKVFKWFSRVVFNSFLARMGVSEADCTERDCMLALAATSAELTKIDMLTEQLKPFAGPQCCVFGSS